jgi:hypothetical protein
VNIPGRWPSRLERSLIPVEVLPELGLGYVEVSNAGGF